jgi:hypothetical protein
MKDDLALMESIGYDTLILNFEAETLEATLDSMSAFAREFIARPS